MLSPSAFSPAWALLAGAPSFGTRLPLRDPSKTAQYLSPFEKIHIRRRGGLLRALTALPKSRDDR